MTVANKNIVDTYSTLFEGLDAFTKLELIERLSKSLKKEKNSKESTFFKSYGAFESDKPAEEIVKEIKAARKFREKDLNF
jgi:predicted CopG family antitoxin